MLNRTGMVTVLGEPARCHLVLTSPEEAASQMRSLGEHPGVWPWGQAVGKLANPAEIMSLWDVHLNCHKRVSRLDVTDREAKRTQEDEVALKPSVVLTL